MDTKAPMHIIIDRLGACSEAVGWARSQPGSSYDAWRRCDRGDWLLWLAVSVEVDHRLVVLVACDCAEPALIYVPESESRPRLAIETARRWAVGEAPLEEVRYAYAAARAAAPYAPAYAAAYAAYAAYANAYAVTHAAAYAADAADANAYGRASSLANSAKLVRARIPWRPVRDALRSI